MKIHIVQKGDTLWEIAKKYNVDFEALKQLNSHLASPDMIMPGMKIRIPADVKTTKKGDDKTQLKDIVEPKKEIATKKDVLPKKQEKLEIPDLPKMPMEKSVTLPMLVGEEEHYTTTVFPQIKEKKEKPKKQQTEPPKQPIKTVQQEQPMYIPPADYAYYPPHPQSMMPTYYPCCYAYSPMMMPSPNCGCCGQQTQMHGYYPPSVHTQGNQGFEMMNSASPQMYQGLDTMNSAPPQMYQGLDTMNSAPPQMYQGFGTMNSAPPQMNQGFNMMNAAPPQMYPNQYSSFDQSRNELEKYPRPPIQQYNPKQSTESKKNQETE